MSHPSDGGMPSINIRRRSIEFAAGPHGGRRASVVTRSTIKGGRNISGVGREHDASAFSRKKAPAWIKALTGGGDHDEHHTEVHVEVEPRGFSSAVSRSGRMVAKECYRCLTTICQVWHSYGKLELTLCNGCVVLHNNDVCGYCGEVDCTSIDDRNLFNCVVCSRCTHQRCEERWRSSGHNERNLCIVCEIGARIRDRDYRAGTVKLLEGDISSVLNYHVFSYSRYFDGPGPKTGMRFRPRDPIVAGDLYTSGDLASVVNGKRRAEASKKQMGNQLVHVVSESFATFDELLALTAKPEVHVKESSEISNIVQKFAKQWDGLSKETIILPDADGLRKRRDGAVMDGGSVWDGSAMGEQYPVRNVSFAKSRVTSVANANDSLEGLTQPLRELGYCYLTRPFPADATPSQLCNPSMVDYGGVYIKLDPNQVLFLFAMDIGLCPGIISKSHVRKLIFQTLGESPKFGSMCRSDFFFRFTITRLLLSFFPAVRDACVCGFLAPFSILVTPSSLALFCGADRHLSDYLQLHTKRWQSRAGL